MKTLRRRAHDDGVRHYAQIWLPELAALPGGVTHDEVERRGHVGENRRRSAKPCHRRSIREVRHCRLASTGAHKQGVVRVSGERVRLNHRDPNVSHERPSL